MGHKFDVKNKRKLDSEQRKKLLPPYGILAELGLNQGETMADIGCGVGYFSIPASEIVGPAGKVYALDISQEMLDEVHKKISQQKILNIVTVKSEEFNFGIENGVADVAFIAFVLHEVEDTERFLLEVKRIISANGRIAILEWKKVKTEFGPPIDHRLDKNYLKGKLEELGFKAIKIKDIGENFYVAVGE